MSGDNKEFFHYESFFDHTYPFFSHHSSDPQGFEAPQLPYGGFTEYLQSSADYGMLSKAFDLSFSTKEEALGAPSLGKLEKKLESDQDAVIAGVSTNENSSTMAGGAVGAMSVTANSSPSSSSVEVAGEEDYGACEKDRKKNEEACEDENGGEKDKNISKQKKKGEKRQREPRFAFMTKSEVDHLEDGYRWRKYGQKAVKNSNYPRSYYRCTTQKCTVKKRVERSQQDPSIVITTYEGQHTHHCPANVRGSSHVLANQSSAMAMAPSFRAELFGRQLTQLGLMANPTTAPSSGYGFLQNLTATNSQQLQIPNYGALLQDIMAPSFVKSSQP